MKYQHPRRSGWVRNMVGVTKIYIRKDVAVGRLHALLNRLRDNIDEQFSIGVYFSDNEIYVCIWTIAGDFPPSISDVNLILKDKVLGDLSYLVRRYE